MNLNLPFYLRIFLVFLACFRFIESVYDGYHYKILYTSGSFHFHIAFLIILLIWSFQRDCMLYVRHRRFLHLISTISIVFSLIVGISLRGLVDSSFEKPTMIKVDHDGYYKGISIDFKMDSTYIVNRYDLGNHYTHGSYHIQDSVITLDKDTVTDLIHSRYLVIHKVSDKKSIVYQTNKDGEPLLKEVSFDVIKDLR